MSILITEDPFISAVLVSVYSRAYRVARVFRSGMAYKLDYSEISPFV